MDLPTFGTTGRRLCVAAAAGLAAVALAAPDCFMTIDVQPACSMGSGCNYAGACQGPTIETNEMFKTTQTGGNRLTTVPLDFLCHMTWKEPNAQGQCVVDKSCDYTVQGNVASGGLCVGGGGGGGQ